MADTPATLFSAPMLALTGNVPGVVESLPNVSLFGARVRSQIAVLTYAAQTAGAVFGIARLPIGAVVLGFLLNSDTSSGSTTLSIGDAHNGNSAKYAALAALTATDTPTWRCKAGVAGVAIATGYDCVSGALAQYEDIILVTAAATAPASGTLVIETFYQID